MSLLTSSMEPFIIINKLSVPDGYGSVKTVYTEGAEIMAAMPYDGSIQAQIAQAMGVKSTYTITVRKSVELDFHTILKRKEDGKTFRITSGDKDNQTPKSAALNMRQYKAEEWKPDAEVEDGQDAST